jgi:hypothetical protein
MKSSDTVKLAIGALEDVNRRHRLYNNRSDLFKGKILVASFVRPLIYLFSQIVFATKFLSSIFSFRFVSSCRDVFSKDLMFETLATIIRVLASGWQTATEDLSQTACNIIIARSDTFFDEFLPLFLTHSPHLSDQQRSSLLSLFQTQKVDLPTLTMNLTQFVNDYNVFGGQ